MYEGVAFGNEVTPLCKLARRLLSICANSASCKRLFSMFGLILTRLRSPLRTKAMADLAELRLHLRDEHLRQGLVKARLQRSTTSHENADTTTAEPQEDSLRQRHNSLPEQHKMIPTPCPIEQTNKRFTQLLIHSFSKSTRTRTSVPLAVSRRGLSRSQ